MDVINYWNRPFSNEATKEYYRSFQDDGHEVVITIPSGDFAPDFYSRNTIQTWDISNSDGIQVLRWSGTTLVESSIHTVTIVNGGTVAKKIEFSGEYAFPDEASPDLAEIEIGPGGSAFFYCTAVYQSGALLFVLRKGSQDDRKI